MKVILQVIEVGVGLTVAMFLGGKLISLFDTDVFNSFRDIGGNFAYLFGFGYYNLFFGILSAILVVMAGRWIMSWASNNGGQTPNNKGN